PEQADGQSQTPWQPPLSCRVADKSTPVRGADRHFSDRAPALPEIPKGTDNAPGVAPARLQKFSVARHETRQTTQLALCPSVPIPARRGPDRAAATAHPDEAARPFRSTPPQARAHPAARPTAPIRNAR